MCVRLSSKGKAASQQKVREENKNGGSNNKYEAMQGTHVHTNIEGSLPSYLRTYILIIIPSSRIEYEPSFVSLISKDV